MNNENLINNKKKLFIAFKNDVPTKARMKRAGANWDYDFRRWYFIETLIPRILSVEMHLTYPLQDYYVSELYILSKEIICRQCNNLITVSLLATDRSYAKKDHFDLYKKLRLMPNITKVPYKLHLYLKQFTNIKHVVISKTKENTLKCFANTCPHCNNIYSDEQLIFSKSRDSFDIPLMYEDSPSIKSYKIISNVVFGINNSDANNMSDVDIDINNLEYLKGKWTLKSEIDLSVKH